MQCKVQKIYKNTRYRILSIEGQTYILDMSQSIWKILFPFLTWLLPNTVYRVDEKEFNEKIRIFQDESTEKRSPLIIGLASVSAGSLLTPLSIYLELGTPPLINFFLNITAILLLFILRSYLSNQNKQKLKDKLQLNKSAEKRIWIRPNTFKSCMGCLMSYLFLLFIGIFSFLAFMEYGNLILLICSSMMFGFVFIANAATVVEGTTKIKFKKDGFYG
ncbi:DUF443 family protein [Oceanobacillus sp. J11TS1]|uniref:DUF443 family protein n=1 Tax=Oceanobacillus sp. J11TS1 TaxID=2807191 RepID=UPI001AFD4849|nr:DUF443 family protein [Oceanobacillus sp. J11TS1]GIO23657.1 hypothetical protein J11TS1_22380 [Oceanobacillus sp. J11TS1]